MDHPVHKKSDLTLNNYSHWIWFFLSIFINQNQRAVTAKINLPKKTFKTMVIMLDGTSEIVTHFIFIYKKNSTHVRNAYWVIIS